MNVPMDRDFLRKRLDKIIENERRSILQRVAEVDESYCHGERNCPRWILERAREIAFGMRQAGTRMAEEVRAIALENSSVLAEDVGKWLGSLADSLVGAHRHRVMAGAGSQLPTVVTASCEHLATELRREREFAVEDVRRCRYAEHHLRILMRHS
jgi:hypothetical protein